MGVYDRPIATAKRLIAAKGKACLWRTFAPAPIDPDKPWNAEASVQPPVETAVAVVFLPAGATRGSRTDDQDVPDGSFQGLMAATPGLSPTRFDTLVDGANEYAVASLDKLAPNGDTVLYTVQFKGDLL